MMWRMSHPKTAGVVCEHCQSSFTVPVQYDEDGPYAHLETEPCHDDECTVQLCPSCPQFACDGCGLKFCWEHHHAVPGDLKVCNVCFAEAEREELELCETGASRCPTRE